MAGMLAMVPAMIGAGSSIAGLFGGSPADNVQLPPQFTMPNMGTAADAAFGTASNMATMPNYAQALMPQYAQTLQTMGANNPGANTMLGGATAGANMGQNASNNVYGIGNFLAGVGGSMMPMANQLFTAGMDPQNALYDRTAHNVQEASRAATSARGLGTSPFAAGVENKAMSDFNIDWQNNLLSRMLSGAQGASGVIGQGTNTMNTGAGLMAGAPQLMMNSSMFPYQAYNQIGGDQFGALNQVSQAGGNAMVQPQQTFDNYLKYLQAGNQAGGVANQGGQLGLNQAQMSFGQNQQMGQNLGRSLAMMGGQMGGGSGGSSNAFFPSSSFMNNSWGWG